MEKPRTPDELLKYHVTGAIERGEGTPIVAVVAETEEECVHEFDPDEGWHCLNCGMDGTEEVLSAIFDRAKDHAKYGG